MAKKQIKEKSDTRQREIVDEYETLSRRISLNEQMIQHLEATVQTLYRKKFVDVVETSQCGVSTLPAGWRMGTLSEIADITMGQSPDGVTYNSDGEGMIFAFGEDGANCRDATL